MPSRRAALALVKRGLSYEQAGQQLGTAPGLAYLAATGVPTDSSDGLSPEDLHRPGLLPAPQRLSSPPVDAPDKSALVRDFLLARASADQWMQSAASSGDGR